MSAVREEKPELAARPPFRDPELQRRYDAAGYVVVPCLDGDQVARLRDGWARADAKIRALPFSASLMSDEREYRGRVNAAIGDAFAEAIGALLDDYRFAFGNFFTKRAATAFPLPLHQDPTFCDESRWEPVNLWVPLVDVTPENGCLRVVPGSHRLNRHVRNQGPAFPYGELYPVIERSYLRDVVMPAGHACMMSPRLFHGSHPNRTGEHRIGASAVAVPAESAAWYTYQPKPDAPIGIYAVGETFHQTHPFGAPPPALQPFARVPYEVEPLDEPALARAFAEASAAK